jgi:hypothetical protein
VAVIAKDRLRQGKVPGNIGDVGDFGKESCACGRPAGKVLVAIPPTKVRRVMRGLVIGFRLQGF